MTKIGNFRFGNDYKADKQTVTLYKGENIRNKAGQVPEGTTYVLNKIEIRYNTRKNLPSYPAMKSLYRWRSVFGYRLGGLLRQGVVKLADIKRPAINTVRFIKAMATGKLHQYNRLYSTRQIFNFMRSANKNSGSVDLIKYTTFNQMPESYHKATSVNDNSIRNILTQKIAHIHQRKEFKRQLEEENISIEARNKKTLGDVPLIDIKSKLKEFDEMSSYVGDIFERAKEKIIDVKERIAFKVGHKIDRMKYFFRETSRSDMKTAYREMVEISVVHEEIYQQRFNGKSSKEDAPKNEDTVESKAEDAIARDKNADFIVKRSGEPTLRYVDAPRYRLKLPDEVENVRLVGKDNMPIADDEDDI